MEYIILDNNVTVNGVEYGNFVNIIEVNESTAKVNISNTEVYLSVPISGVGVEPSLRTYLANNIEV